MSKITISVIIILLIILIPEIVHENLKIKKVKNPVLNDGDIVMFRFETPLLYWSEGVRNSSMYIGKCIQNSMFYWFHRIPYTHVGIVVNGQILHLTSDPMYDQLSNTYKVGKPVFSSIEDIYTKPSLMYLYRVNKNVNVNLPATIPDVKIRNDVLDAVLEHVFRAPTNDTFYSCARFVDHIQHSMGIRDRKNKYADLRTVMEGYTGPVLIESPWSDHRGF